ncbi:MAG: hypothetical protein WCF95_01255 [bacterium]
MDKFLKRFLGLLTILLIFFIIIPKAQAVEAILNGIEVKPLNDSYEITINTDHAVPIKTLTPMNNKMFIDLKNIIPSKSVNTVYNNASNIDHVLIQPMDKDVRITIQGLNVAASQVLLDSPKVPTNLLANTEGTQITLNRSIDSYSPITQEDTETDFSDIFSLTNLDLRNLLDPANLGWFIGLGVLLLVLVKNLQETKEQAKKYELTPKDILQQKEELTKKAKDIDLHAEISKAQGKFNERLIKRQDLSKKNVSVQNYGIKEYQNSQTNPYTQVSKNPNVSMPKTPPQTSAPNLNKLQEAVQAINQKSQNTPVPEVATMEKKAPDQRDIKKAQMRLNNMKFLESMTRIYEKNGRVDMAQNIKESMRKSL